MFLLIDKPKGITSHDVIDELRKITGIRKIGHAGTLDPNATGLLVVGVGRDSTKKLGFLTMGTKKTYIADIVLGQDRTTGDSEGTVVREMDKAREIKQTQIKKILKSFKGEQSQMPPAFSAIKINGKKAYQLAREGKKVRLRSRKIMIYSIKLLSYNYPSLQIETEVSSGTYIRALAMDIGKKSKTGAYLNNLKRTKIDKYKLDKAVKLYNLGKNNWKKYAFNLK